MAKWSSRPRSCSPAGRAGTGNATSWARRSWENHPPLTTINPAFELEYYRWALGTAQRWRKRRGLARNAEWDRVIAGLPPPPERDGLYLPVETEPDFWRSAASPECSRHATPPRCLNRDHPSFLMAFGPIPGPRVDPATMRRTLAATESHWDLRQTWGWDFPVAAMAAARLGEPEKTVEWLFRDVPNNRWGVSGMTPRVHLEEEKQLVGRRNRGGGARRTGLCARRRNLFPLERIAAARGRDDGRGMGRIVGDRTGIPP